MRDDRDVHRLPAAEGQDQEAAHCHVYEGGDDGDRKRRHIGIHFPRQQITRGGDGQRCHNQQRARRKAFRAGPDDDEHADETDDDRHPAPPAHRFAQEERRTQRHHQWQGLQYGRGIGKFDEAERRQIKNGGGHLAETAQDDDGAQEGFQGPERAEMPGRDIDQHHGHDAADEHDLTGVDVGGDGLRQRVVGREACHCERHEKRAARIVRQCHSQISQTMRGLLRPPLRAIWSRRYGATTHSSI